MTTDHVVELGSNEHLLGPVLAATQQHPKETALLRHTSVGFVDVSFRRAAGGNHFAAAKGMVAMPAWSGGTGSR